MNKQIKRYFIIAKIISIIIFIVLLSLQLNHIITISWLLITFPIWIWVIILAGVFISIFFVTRSLKDSLFKN